MPGEHIDRGDDFVPTDPTAAEAEAAAAAAALAKTTVAAEAAAEAEAAAAAEAEAAAAAEAAAEGEEGEDGKPAKGGKKDTRVPLARHEALLTKEREARAEVERKLAQYEKGAKVADLNVELTAAEEKLVKLEAEYSKLVADADVEKASAKMAEIRRLERQVSESKADMKIAAAVATATEAARYNLSLERVEAAFPKLNPDHEDFDAALLSDVADLKVTYERRGMTPTDALQKAVKLLVPTETAKQADAVVVKPRVDAKDVAAERKAAAVDKTLKAVNATPPATGKVGMDSDKAGGTISAKDVMKMSDKDFKALSEDEKSRMRGDTL